ATSNKQQATSNKQQATSNKQQATSNKQQATSNKQQATSNTTYLNVLRVFSCIAVIIYHVFGNLANSFEAFLTGFENYISIILVNIWLWHVPSFVMISGVIFLNKEKEITIPKLLIKYVSRILLALFIFGIPFAFMEIFFDAHYQFNIAQIGLSILNVFEGKSWSHMWYLYMIAGLYLLLPLFKLFVNYASRRTLEYVLVILFLFTSVIPTFQNMLPFKFGIYIPINIFVFYLLLGHYIHQYDICINNRTIFFMVLLYVLYVVLMPMNKDFITSTTHIIGLYSNISPLVVMITFCIFCYLRQNINSNKLFDFISPHVFGMYLIHPFFLNIFFKFIKFTPDRYPFVLVVVVITTMTIMLSLLFSIISRKIKIIKKYVL
ncbi:MAG: acyltransferase, partial [Treponema sp.]|nr:acyltransferase [Treponema sp.]